MAVETEASCAMLRSRILQSKEDLHNRVEPYEVGLENIAFPCKRFLHLFAC
jgi:hypothetical protein